MSRSSFWLALTVLLGFVGVASAKDMADPNSGCHFTVPDDWTIVHPPAGNASASQAVNPDHTKSALLYISTVSSQASIADGSPLVQGVEAGLLKNGANILSREHRKLAGTDFYVMTVSLPNGVQSQMWVTALNGHMYEVGLYAKADPSKDADLTTALNSLSIPPK
jgi:hypothetical protein